MVERIALFLYALAIERRVHYALRYPYPQGPGACRHQPSRAGAAHWHKQERDERDRSGGHRPARLAYCGHRPGAWGQY